MLCKHACQMLYAIDYFGKLARSTDLRCSRIHLQIVLKTSISQHVQSVATGHSCRAERFGFHQEQINPPLQSQPYQILSCFNVTAHFFSYSPASTPLPSSDVVALASVSPRSPCSSFPLLQLAKTNLEAYAFAEPSSASFPFRFAWNHWENSLECWMTSGMRASLTERSVWRVYWHAETVDEVIGSVKV